MPLPPDSSVLRRSAVGSSTRLPLASLGLIALLAAAGCTPLPAFHFAETSSVLKRGSVSITAAGGAGAAHTPASTEGEPGTLTVVGGVGGRVRVGVGAKQEIGVDATGLFIPNDDGAKPTLDKPWSAKLSWKGAPLSWLAFVAGVGPSHYLAYGLGGDLGFILSPKLPLVPLRLYTGGRIGLAGPLSTDAFEIGGLSLTGVVPLGLAIELPLVRIFLEGGFVGSRTWARDNTGEVDRVDGLGGYGLVGLGLYLGRTD